ncbi:MAG TPA: CHC2 zinc finger domain-containing protein [Planctomycetota bacterium]|nr:CHC2 zinc finger domain-containing protein [Planctomycetota bacterium]
MTPKTVKDYYAQVTAIDIGEVARGLLEDRLTSQSGHELRFDCPHHASQSKTSFIVDTEQQGFWCKGCRVGGDVLQLVEFVQSGKVTSHQKGPMPESHRRARDYLASLAGLPPLAEFGLSPEEQQKAEARRREADLVFGVLTDAAEFYHEKLLANKEALMWLAEHYAISRQTIERLKIGFADNKGLVDAYLVGQRKHDREVIDRSGLYVRAKDGQFYPFFRKRVVFPYWKQGRVVYLIGRKTPWTPEKEHEKAKYKKLPVHSPGRPYISEAIRNDVIYGEDCLTTAREEVVITEGITDCIALAERGIPCISPVTVAFREQDHEKLLGLVRHVKRVYICQDNEVSGVGLAGALKTARFLCRAGVDVRLVELPLGEKHRAAREALAAKGIPQDATPEQVQQAKAALGDAGKAEIDRLLADAKIDLNEYLLTATVDDFRKLMAEALPPVHWQIKRLNPNPPSDAVRLEQLKPVLRAAAELDPFGQEECIALVQQHYGNPRSLSKTLLREQLRKYEAEFKAERRRSSSGTGTPEGGFQVGGQWFRVRGNRIVWVRKDTDKDGRVREEEVAVTNFRIAIERACRIEHGVRRPDLEMHCLVHTEVGETYPLVIAGREFQANNRLIEALGSVAGGKLDFESNCVEVIRRAAVLNADFPTITEVRCFGPHPRFGYVSPSVVVKDGEPHPTETLDFVCNLAALGEDSAKLLDLSIIDDQTFLRTARHILDELFHFTSPYISCMLLGHTFLAPVFHRLSNRYNPFVLFCAGPSGKGKTSAAHLYQNFYGHFPQKTSLCAWGSTPNQTEKAGFYFNGALFVVDDFKRSNLDKGWPAAKRILQGYADGHARRRLTRTSDFMAGEHIRGMLLVTGEDLPDGEASNLARMIILDFDHEDYTPEKKDLYWRCLDMCPYYRGVTARYIAWTQRQSEDDILALVNRHYNELDAHIGRLAIENRPRIIQNFALSMTGLHLFLSFLEESGVADEAFIVDLLRQHLGRVRLAVREMGETIRGEKASEIFLATLKSLIASQEVLLAKVFPVATKDATFDFAEGQPLHGTVVGYVDEAHVYIDTVAAMKKVKEARQREGSPLQFSAKAITGQLLGDGLIEPNNDEHAATRGSWRIYIRTDPQTIRSRVYKFRREVFGD